jgi:eukaryotic-like serine/threonine-protein kinase
MSLETPLKIRMLQRKLYQKAKEEPNYRFYLLYDKMYREDLLAHAYALAKSNQGAPGVDGQSFWDIESRGLEEWLSGVREELRAKTYQPQAVRRVMIPKPGGVVDAANSRLAWYDRGGKLLGTVGEPGDSTPAISPDQESVAFTRGVSLWRRDLKRGTDQILTTDGVSRGVPIWSPQGDRIAYGSSRDGLINLFKKVANASGRDELLVATSNSKAPTQWSRDFLVYHEFDPQTKRNIWVLPMQAGVAGKPILFLGTAFDELFGQLSPDGHWMAYTSDESGQREVYVRPFPAADAQRPALPSRISIAGGEQPRWRGDGKELFFDAADGKMTAVAVTAVAGSQPSFAAGSPQELFDAHMVRTENGAQFQYDVTTDGKRFLVDSNTSAAASTKQSTPPLTVMVNWNAGQKE